MAALGAAMLPLRSHLAVSTDRAGARHPGRRRRGASAASSPASACVAAGFLVFDFFFIPPYGTLNVGSAQNWVALFVYLVVMLLVARVVARLDTSRVEAERGGAAARRLSELSELLVGERPVGDLLTTIVGAIHTAFAVPSVALLVLDEGTLRVAAAAGEPLTPDELSALEPHSGVTVSLGVASGAPGELRTIALVASGRPVGILAVRGLPESATDRAVLHHLRQRRGAGDRARAPERAGAAHPAPRGGRPVPPGADGRGEPRPAHPAGHHQGGVLDAVEPVAVPRRGPGDRALPAHRGRVRPPRRAW